MPVAGICRKAGISQATCFNWKKKYGGLLPDEMRCLKLLEDEVVLDREGWRHNIKKTYSVYRAMGMQLRNMIPKRRVKGKLREDRAEALGPKLLLCDHALRNHPVLAMIKNEF